MKHMIRNLLGIILTAAMTLSLVGCNPAGPQTAGDTVKLTYVNWAEGVAYTHLAKLVLEEKLGYNVEITSADVGPAYTAVAQGSHDAFMECWPSLHEDYLEKYKGKLVDLGTVYEGTETGLAVPSYVTIDKISQLNEYADKFGGKITGIDAGAGMMKKTENELIPAYGLDKMKLMASSGPAMTAALKDAIAHEEWIVVTAWKPHWMFGRWDLKFLEQDSDKIMWKRGNIQIIGRQDLAQDKPELAEFLSNMRLTDPELAGLMLQIEESDDDVLEVARQWMNENESVVMAWLP